VAVTSLAFSLRDKAIASGSVDGKLILYNTVTGQGCSPLQTSSHQVRPVFHGLFLSVFVWPSCRYFMQCRIPFKI